MFDDSLRLTHIEGVTFNFVVGDAECCPLLCGNKHDPTSPVVRVPLGTTMFDLLVLSGFFPSKGQARKNWKGPAEIPAGYSEFEVGKGQRRQIFFIVSPFDPTK